MLHFTPPVLAALLREYEPTEKKARIAAATLSESLPFKTKPDAACFAVAVTTSNIRLENR